MYLEKLSDRKCSFSRAARKKNIQNKAKTPLHFEDLNEMGLCNWKHEYYSTENVTLVIFFTISIARYKRFVVQDTQGHYSN
jgi:hypothetical protein